MGKAQLHLDELTEKYKAAMESYLRQGGETALVRAYELGRQCLAEGRGILDMVSMHHQALHAAMDGAPRIRTEALHKAGEFFNECMSPYEMTHRAFGEANLALRHLNETLEDQARHIARELHDEAGQLLAAVHISLDEVGQQLPAESRKRLQRVKDLLVQIETQLRDLSHELRPTVLDDLGLVAALEFLAQRLSKRTGLRIAVQPFDGTRLPPPVEVALYRIVQEALNNVSKHARASSVRIQLRKNENTLHCLIADDGVGFQPEEVRKASPRRGLGLVGIQERLQALGGNVQIQSAPGRGTKLQITVPLEGSS